MKKSYFKIFISIPILVFLFIGCDLFGNKNQEIPTEQVTIYYYSEYESEDFPDNKTVEKGYKLTKEDLPELSRYGYIFDGWNCKVGDEVNSDLYIKANWTIGTYELTFDFDNGEEILKETKVYDSFFPKIPKPKKEGYDFVGWNPELPDYVPGEDTVYKAVWDKIGEVTYYFNYYLEDRYYGNYCDPIKGDYGEIPEFTINEYEGYEYKEHKLKNPDVEYENHIQYVDVYYVYKSYKIIFDTDGGEEIEPQEVKYKSPVPSISDLPIPVKTNHTFINWQYVNFYSNLMPAHDVTVKAYWDPNRSQISLTNPDENRPSKKLFIGYESDNSYIIFTVTESDEAIRESIMVDWIIDGVLLKDEHSSQISLKKSDYENFHHSILVVLKYPDDIYTISKSVNFGEK